MGVSQVDWANFLNPVALSFLFAQSNSGLLFFPNPEQILGWIEIKKVKVSKIERKFPDSSLEPFLLEQ